MLVGYVMGQAIRPIINEEGVEVAIPIEINSRREHEADEVGLQATVEIGDSMEKRGRVWGLFLNTPKLRRCCFCLKGIRLGLELLSLAPGSYVFEWIENQSAQTGADCPGQAIYIRIVTCCCYFMS